MKYEQFRTMAKDLNRINLHQFLCPDAFYRPTYIWTWNDRIISGTLRFQLKDMHGRGIGGVWQFPWPNCRPHTMPSTMSPAYLGKRYLQLYKRMVQEADRLGMKVWLYDEGGFPSGGAFGRVVRENPQLAEQTLIRKELTPKPGTIIKIPSDCITAFLYRGRFLIRQVKPSEKIAAIRPHTRILIFQRQIQARDSWYKAYPDLLNPKSTVKFLEYTHEKFRKAVGKYFGNTIPLVFSDEPRVWNPPWTEGLLEDFKREKGYDIAPVLPSLFEGKTRSDMQVRIDYFDWWSRHFAENYFGRIQKWCRRHRLLSTGHIGGEDRTLGPVLYGFGHPLRIYRKMDIPGTDTIWRQIFPPGKGVSKGVPEEYRRQMKNHYFPKYASSVAHQDDKPWVITESFAVYGAGLTPAEMKWITDFQYVRGVNLMSVSGYSLSTKGINMGRARPLFGPFNSLWKHMDIFHAYAARLSYLLSRGTPDIQTAIYYPVRDIWAQGPEVKRVAASNDKLSAFLLEHQTDFDFIDDDILESASTTISGAGLKTGAMTYQTVFLSRTRWIGPAGRRKLVDFARAGGKLIWAEKPDDVPAIPGCVSAEYDRLEKYLEPLVEIFGVSRKSFRVCRRKTAEGSLYFIVNEAARSIEGTLRFPETAPPVILNPEDGTCRAPLNARRSKDGWDIFLSLDFSGSCVFFFGEGMPVRQPYPETEGKTLLNLSAGWTARKIREYRLGKEDFEIIDCKNSRPVSIRLGDWRSAVGGEFSGDVEYIRNFDCSAGMAKRAKLLHLGKVNYACDVFLNGKNLGRKIWPSFSFPVRNILRPGRNQLKIVITNTMANQYVTTRAFDRWPENIKGPWHQISGFFEHESLTSGLFGPVRLLN